MKFTLNAVVLGLIVLFSGAVIKTQSPSKFNAKIDFNFHVAGKSFEAGDYVIEKIGSFSETYLIRRRDEKARTLFTVMTVHGSSAGRTRNEFSLLFKRYGDEYFLEAISNKAIAFEATLLKSKAHLQVARRFAKDKPIEVAVVSKSEK